MVAILKVGINVNNCNTNIDSALDKKADLRVKFPKGLRAWAGKRVVN